MALKAGTVGLDPKYVDKDGKPISDVDLSNYYTKSETDGKLDNKANLSYITANNKKFQFAYDSESGKYGYKAGAQDDFHPFESAGAPGWNKPADLITTDVTYGYATYEEGGYYVDEATNILYFDFIVSHSDTNYSARIYLPFAIDTDVSGTQYIPFLTRYGTTKEDVKNYFPNDRDTYTYVSSGSAALQSNMRTQNYYHMWGCFPIPTT